MNENPFENLKPMVIILSKEDYDRLMTTLDKEPTDEQLAKLTELMSRPQRIESGQCEPR